jgi:hypothetical protein
MPFPPDKDKDQKPPADDSAPDAAGGDETGDSDDLFDEEDIVGDEGGAADPGEGGDAGGVESPIPDPGDQDTAQLISKAAAVLAEHTGLTIEPSEDPLEFLRHIITAAATHSATKSKMGADQAGQMQTGMGAQDGQATEEQRPYLMSTENKPILLSATLDMPLSQIAPQHRVAAKLYRGRNDEARKNRHKVLERLEKAGVPRERIQDLKGRVDGYQLSLDAVGGVVPQPVDTELRIWLDAAKHFKGPQLLSTLTGGKLPAGVRRQERAGKPGRPSKSQEEDDRRYMIERAGLTVPDKK